MPSLSTSTPASTVPPDAVEVMVYDRASCLGRVETARVVRRSGGVLVVFVAGELRTWSAAQLEERQRAAARSRLHDAWERARSDRLVRDRSAA